MTREAFINILVYKGYLHKIEGDKLIVTTKKNLEVDIYLNELVSLPPNVVFENEGDVNLIMIQNIPTSVEFKNEGGVLMAMKIGDWYGDWLGNIRGISHNTLLNGMIKRGLFL